LGILEKKNDKERGEKVKVQFELIFEFGGKRADAAE